MIMKLRLPFGEIAHKRFLCRVWLLNVCLCLSSALNPNAVAPQSPGVGRLGYPGISSERIIQPQSGCVISSTNQNRRNRLAVGIRRISDPRVAEATTLGCRTQP